MEVRTALSGDRRRILVVLVVAVIGKEVIGNVKQKEAIDDDEPAEIWVFQVGELETIVWVFLCVLLNRAMDDCSIENK